MKKVMLIFGTRPEAIKMGTLVNELKKRNDFKTIVCVTGQHLQMLKQVLDIFKIIPDYNLSIMKDNQTLFTITSDVLMKLENILDEVKPDIVLVHGDTTTTFAASLACFYKKIKIGHVEAGLRTGDIYSPYPEEFNRLVTDIVSSLYFTPTKTTFNNLIKEGINKEKIYITGNTAIDVLRTTIKDDFKHPIIDWAKGSKLILLTTHRRENLGEPMVNIFMAINKLLNENDNIKIVFPMHHNPIIKRLADKALINNPNIKIIEPQDIINFHNIMNASYLILTDSGGIQEEATFLGKPILVLRDTTERPEGVEHGALKLVGTDSENIITNTMNLLDNQNEYKKMIKNRYVFGDGHASEKIVNILMDS